jgi:hypothetical protein
MQAFGLQYIRRNVAGGHMYFIVYRGDRSIDGWIALKSAAQAVGIFDPMSGRFGHAPVRRTANRGCEVYLQLTSGQSIFVQTYDSPAAGPEWSYKHAVAESQPLAGTWSVNFIKGGPELPAEAKIDKLESWTNFGGEAGKAFSGTAKYTVTFAKPPAAAEAYRLDLGRVADSCRVSLNGEELGALIAPPFQVDVPTDKLKDQNTLEVFVSNLMANRIADMDRRGVVWKKFYNANIAAHDAANRDSDGFFSAAKWTPRESGLIGPVTLTPLGKFDPMAAK